MNVFEKVLRIVEAEIHSALDHVEDPEAMLEQALRDGEEELAQSRARIADVMAAKAAIEEEKHREWATHLQWEARAAKAIESGETTAARDALAFSLEHQRKASLCEERLSAAETDLSSLREAMTRRERKLNALRERKDGVLDRLRGAEVEDLAEGLGGPGESPLDLYARMEAKVKKAYYRGEAAQRMAEEELARKLDALSSESGPSQAVKDKLAAMKARLGGSE